jgi:putative transposase
VERLWRSVKHEDEYLKGYATMGDLTLGLTRCFAFTNGERPHQSLGSRTPDEAQASGQGGGARIVARFGGVREASPAPLGYAGDASRAKTGQRCSAASAFMDAAYIQAETVSTIGSTLITRKSGARFWYSHIDAAF